MTRDEIDTIVDDELDGAKCAYFPERDTIVSIPIKGKHVMYGRVAAFIWREASAKKKKYWDHSKSIPEWLDPHLMVDLDKVGRLPKPEFSDEDMMSAEEIIYGHD